MAATAGPSKPASNTYSFDDLEPVKYDSDSDEDLDDIGEYCFETGRLAYKANTDYKNVIETIVVLKALRAQAIRDKQQLLEFQEMALSDPLEFVEKLKRKDLCIPKPQHLPQIPPIDWSKYDISGNHKSEFGQRQLRLIAAANSERKRKSRMGGFESPLTSNFNKPWSADEQQKLEKLLIQFPPEEIEMRRWEKISAALGSRTPVQVASRVQKHFDKLVKAGIPVPGKPPRWSYRSKLKKSGNFGQKHPPEVDVNDDALGNSSSEEVSDEDDVSPELRTTPEYKELLLVKKVLKKKMKRSQTYQGRLS